MSLNSPLNGRHEEMGGFLAAYGPPVAGSAVNQPSDATHPAGAGSGTVVGVVQTYGELEREYAALRGSAVLLDSPQRATLVVTGSERLEFLNRMLTQELKGVPEWSVRRSFWLNRKGRIDADLRVLVLPDRVLMDVDVHAVQTAQRTLTSYIITEDCSIEDQTDALHRLEVHGPRAAGVLAKAAGTPVDQLAADAAMEATIAGARVIIDRWDCTGVPGYSVLCPTERVEKVYTAILNTGDGGQEGEQNAPLWRAVPPRTMPPGAVPSGAVPPGVIPPKAASTIRPAGWHAFNIARIEHGTPLFNMDFGPENLPAETGVLNDRVSFTKGCYLGQEIVARMHARGHPKQVLVGLRGPSIDFNSIEAAEQPEGGMALHESESEAGDAVGAITSSTISPMLGAGVVCFGSVKYAHREAGKTLYCRGSRGWIPLRVQESLRSV